jgi:ABC-type dipeptide/oligopeptide/nickel transport system permease subunit
MVKIAIGDRRLRRFARNRTALFGIGVLIAFLIIASFGPLFAPYDPNRIYLFNTFEGPSWQHPLGRDQLGRDILSRIIYGSRISFLIGIIPTGAATLIGTVLGLIAGYYSGIVDDVIMRITDMVMAFPSFLLALIIIGIVGPGIHNVIIAISIAFIPRFIRQSRGSTLVIKENEFIEAARAIGVRGVGILLRHILPNGLAPIIVQATLLIGDAVLISSGLGFLGLGVQPPTPEWGAMLSDGRGYLATAPHIATFPGLAIFLMVIGFNLMGDGLRDALDIQLERA